MEPFGAEIGLALSSLMGCLVQTADLRPTVCLLSPHEVRHSPSPPQDTACSRQRLVVDQDMEKLGVLQRVGVVVMGR